MAVASFQAVGGKEVIRKFFNLPKDDRITLAMDFMTYTRGSDILEETNVPSG
ncbi:MAG TPA: hypothetical protein VH500_16375 [Nitrososphaeraceae archaeon]